MKEIKMHRNCKNGGYALIPLDIMRNLCYYSAILTVNDSGNVLKYAYHEARNGPIFEDFDFVRAHSEVTNMNFAFKSRYNEVREWDYDSEPKLLGGLLEAPPDVEALLTQCCWRIAISGGLQNITERLDQFVHIKMS